MKNRRCPFCGLQNKNNDMSCLNCGKIYNSYRPNTVYKPKLTKDINILSIDDFDELARACVESISGMEESRIVWLQEFARNFVEVYFLPTFESLIETGKVDSSNSNEIKSNIDDLTYFWALINFMIGVEYNSKRLSDKEISVYLPAVNFPFGYHLIEFRFLLKSRNIENNVSDDSSEKQFISTLLSLSKNVFNEGTLNADDIKPNILIGELTPFSIELKQIKTL